MRLATLLLCTVIAAYPQGFSAGVKAGVPVTDAFHTGSNGPLQFFSQTKRLTVGPTFELRLPFGLGIEFDALYKRLNYDRNSNLIDAISLAATTGNAWEFPLLAKYRVGHGPIKPYIDGGVSFNNLSGLTQFTRNTFFPGSRVTTSSGTPLELRNRFRSGVVLGGGLELHALFLRISPEIRYTRWDRDSFIDSCCGGGIFRSNRNQADFLLGITF